MRCLYSIIHTNYDYGGVDFVWGRLFATTTFVGQALFHLFLLDPSLFKLSNQTIQQRHIACLDVRRIKYALLPNSLGRIATFTRIITATSLIPRRVISNATPWKQRVKIKPSARPSFSSRESHSLNRIRLIASPLDLEAAQTYNIHLIVCHAYCDATVGKQSLWRANANLATWASKNATQNVAEYR